MTLAAIQQTLTDYTKVMQNFLGKEKSALAAKESKINGGAQARANVFGGTSSASASLSTMVVTKASSSVPICGVRKAFTELSEALTLKCLQLKPIQLDDVRLFFEKGKPFFSTKLSTVGDVLALWETTGH